MTAKWSGGVALLLAAILAGACAGTGAPTMALPPARTLQPSDLAGLAGEWQGTLRGTIGIGHHPGRSAVGRVTVSPDGSYTSNVDGAPGVGKARIEGGWVIFEGSTTRGTATFYEGGGRQVLKGEGTWVGLDGHTEFELTKR
jgi:hypothetical protein